MKKLLLLTAVLFASTIFGFSLNSNLSSNTLSLEVSSYDSISFDLFVGDVRDGQVITVDFVGEYVGCTAGFIYEGEKNFMINARNTGKNVHIGDVVSQRDGKMITYRVIGNLSY